jgi:hypothetical protein
MADYDTIVRERQKAIRREMNRRGIAIKAVQFDGGWDSPSTVLSYFPADAEKQPQTMSVAALYRLLETGALPPDLLSLMLPAGFALVRVPEGVDHDEMAEAMQDWLAAKHAAHHPASEAGRDIGPGEDDSLRKKLVLVKAA